jgi:hypothetical protein
VREPRKHGPDVWVYRYSERIDGRKIRRKVIIGTVAQFPGRPDALRACEHLQMTANAESARGPQVTMRGLIDRYVAEILTPCLNVPLGGVRDDAARMSPGCAQRYWYVLRKWILVRWEDHSVFDFEERRVWTAAEK